MTDFGIICEMQKAEQMHPNDENFLLIFIGMLRMLLSFVPATSCLILAIP